MIEKTQGKPSGIEGKDVTSAFQRTSADAVARYVASLASRAADQLTHDDLNKLGAMIDGLLSSPQVEGLARGVNFAKPLIMSASGGVAFAGFVEQGRKGLTRLELPSNLPSEASIYRAGDNLVRVGARTFKIQTEDGVLYASSIDDAGGPQTLNKRQRAVLARPRPDKPASAEENRPGKMVRVRLTPSLVEILDKKAANSTRTDVIEAILARHLPGWEP